MMICKKTKLFKQILKGEGQYPTCGYCSDNQTLHSAIMAGPTVLSVFALFNYWSLNTSKDVCIVQKRPKHACM